MVRVSIVLPVYQGLPFLRQCVQSIQNQTLQDFEVFISDDGSKDGSRAFLAEIHDPRFHYFPNHSRQGLFASLNSLLGRTPKGLVRILCQDDLLEPDCLETEWLFHQANPGLAFSFCKATQIDEKDKLIALDSVSDLPSILKSDLMVQHLYYHGCIPGNLSTVCLNTNVIQPLFDTRFEVAGDYDLWSRLALTFDTGVLQKRLIQLRVHKGQLSQSHRAGILFIEENQRVRGELFPHLPPAARKKARRYTKMRQDVLDFHHSLVAAYRGQKTQVFRLWKHRGWKNFFVALGWWLATASNRLYRPQAPWVLDRPSEI